MYFARQNNSVKSINQVISPHILKRMYLLAHTRIKLKNHVRKNPPLYESDWGHQLMSRGPFHERFFPS